MRNLILYKALDLWYLFDFNSRNIHSDNFREICQKIKRGDNVYSIQVPDFIREFNNLYPIKSLPILIDIECFVKQFWQRQKPLESQKKWNLFKFLKANGYLSKEFKIQDSISDYLISIFEFIEDAKNNKSPEELNRLLNIEIPINNLIYKRQRKGFKIDETIYPDLIKKTEEELYAIKNELQLKHNIFTPDKLATQIKVLNDEGIEYKGSLLTLFKSNKSNSDLCSLFYQMLRAKNDLSALLYLTSSKGGISRTYPNYYGFGTISSRITLREPAVQNLSKSARIVIKPDKYFEFTYVDYSQFEAGILASLSKDEILQKLYDSDIYDDLNKKVWGGDRSREDAKILFYKFMYGIKFKSNIENQYFNSFTKLTKFKNDIEEGVKSTNKVGSSYGNNRILEVEDKTIALSHRIQAEASLIFKKAILKVSNEVSEAEFVLPMHDAALYQINTKLYDKKSIDEKIRNVFLDVFSIMCPGIKHSVKIKNFYGE